MLAPNRLPDGYAEFNRSHHAPYGTRLASRLHRLRRSRLHLRLAGPYAWQTNSPNRVYEYPWAHEQIAALGSHLVIADVGASLAGLQFTLAQEGHEVHAVDPGLNASGLGWEVEPARRRQHLTGNDGGGVGPGQGGRRVPHRRQPAGSARRAPTSWASRGPVSSASGMTSAAPAASM